MEECFPKDNAPFNSSPISIKKNIAYVSVRLRKLRFGATGGTHIWYPNMGSYQVSESVRVMVCRSLRLSTDPLFSGKRQRSLWMDSFLSGRSTTTKSLTT